MSLVFVWMGLAFATQLWLCIRVARSSVGWAVATFLLGPFGAVVPAIKQHGDEETSVTVPFIAHVVFTVLFVVSGWSHLQEAIAQQEAQLYGEPVAAAKAPEAPVAQPSEAAASSAASSAVSPAETGAAAVEAASGATATPSDPLEGYSAALREVGVAHTVSRLPAGAEMPKGVVDAVQITAQARPVTAASAAAPGTAAATTTAASAPPPAEYSATVFRCESPTACKGIAGAYLQMGDQKRRVLQNGSLLLVMPRGVGEDDFTLTALAGVFRRL